MTRISDSIGTSRPSDQGRLDATRRRRDPRPLVVRLAVVAAAAGIWELVARVFVTNLGTSKDPVVPSLEYLITNSFLRLSDFWQGGLGAPAPSRGGQETYWGAVLAVGDASAASLRRIFLGVAIGLIIGGVVGLITSASRPGQALLAPAMHFLRMVPFLALAPLFEVWFGKSDEGAVAFIAYGVAVVVFTGTIGSVSLVPDVYFARAATSGAGVWRTYRNIVLPAIVPTMRATLLIAVGLAWTLDVAAEILGTQSGLGVMMDYALRFSYTGRVIVVAFIYLLFAAVTYYLIDFITGRMIRWQPRHDLG